MDSYNNHLISSSSSIKEALAKLNELAMDAILFVVDNQNTLIGSLTDGDIRRGILSGLSLEDKVAKFIQQNPKYIQKGDSDILKIIQYRDNNFRILPVVDAEKRVIDIVNFRTKRSYLPIDVVIMAGGRGERLRPLTDTLPKPMLMVGNKPILEHNIDRFSLYGVQNIWISVKYLGDKIQDYFGDGSGKSLSIKYIWEDEPLGTIGALSLVQDFQHDYVLVANSDLLTNIDYEQFFTEFIQSDADFAVVTIPYTVNIPYAILETVEGKVKDFKEKPSYTYYANGGIYLMKKEILKYIPKSQFFNTTDLMEILIEKGYHVFSYPLVGYWLDIGKHEDFNRAQEDVKHIQW